MKTAVIDGKTFVELNSDSDEFVGTKSIVRCRDAGVHYGTVLRYEGRVCVLANSRRLWSWKTNSEHTLSGIVRTGLDADESKLSGVVPLIYLPEICEIMPCSEVAIKTIEAAPVHNA